MCTETNNGSFAEILRRMRDGLEAAVDSISSFKVETIKTEFKASSDPVTEADRAANNALREILLREGEGWLSEESADDLMRLKNERVWVVDPLDGTREFLAGTPEWCISIALVENGRAVAGGVCNPATGELFLGARGQGVTLNGKPVGVSERKKLSQTLVLASRSEVKRGEWDCFLQAPFVIRPVGSVAYKLALVASGLADATWTFCPKHEWDVAGGIALVEIAGGFVEGPGGSPIVFNRASTLLPGLLAGGSHLHAELTSWLRERKPAAGSDCEKEVRSMSTFLNPGPDRTRQ